MSNGHAYARGCKMMPPSSCHSLPVSVVAAARVASMQSVAAYDDIADHASFPPNVIPA
eukprot:m.164380 g.164380  ORF g.164380 m.164380 type:complete len:58 (-) comp12414_c0_seq1:686-859(-)